MAAHATIGALATDGWLPYRDVVDNKQPLPYLAYAAADVVAPRSTSALRILATGVAALAGVTILLLTRRRLGLPRATAAAVLAVLVGASRWVEGVDLNTEHLLVMTGTLAVLVAVRWPDRPWSPLAAGVLLGVAALTKAPGVLFALPAAVPLLARRRERGQGAVGTALSYGVGSLIPVAAVVGFYAAHGALAELWYWNVGYNLGYVEVAHEATNSWFTLNLKIWPVLVVGLLGLIGACVAWKRTDRRIFPATVIVWLIAAYVGAKLGGREFPHYYAPLVVPAVLGVALAIPDPRRARRPALAMATAAAVVLAAAAPAAYDVSSQYGQDPDALSIRLYRITQAVPWTHQDEVGEWLHRRAGACDELFVVGNEPGFYWASGIPPATPYLFDGHQAVRPDFWDEIARRLGEDPPRWLVFPRGEPSWHPYVEPLQHQGYRVAAVFGPVHVLELPEAADETCGSPTSS